MVDQTPTRDDEIKAIHREYRLFYQILGRSFLVGIGILIGLLWFSSDLDRSAYIVNLFTTFLGTLATVLVIDFLSRRRDEQRELHQLQDQLVRDAGSTSNEIAKNAVHQLWKRGWLVGDSGLLRRANLLGANLHEANLRRANLIGTDLRHANLVGAKLIAAQLERADLNRANLGGADLTSAHLEEANLAYAELNGANLTGARLQWADLRGANLDKTTILPDWRYWTPDTDLTKFGCIIE